MHVTCHHGLQRRAPKVWTLCSSSRQRQIHIWGRSGKKKQPDFQEKSDSQSLGFQNFCLCFAIRVCKCKNSCCPPFYFLHFRTLHCPTSVCEACRSLSFSSYSFITPTLIYTYSIQLSLCLFIINQHPSLPSVGLSIFMIVSESRFPLWSKRVLVYFIRPHRRDEVGLQHTHTLRNVRRMRRRKRTGNVLFITFLQHNLCVILCMLACRHHSQPKLFLRDSRDCYPPFKLIPAEAWSCDYETMCGFCLDQMSPESPL